MAARTLKVEFLPTDHVVGTRVEAPRAEVHDISLDEAVQGVPEVLENPHVDFPGTWSLVGDGVEGSYRYQRVDRIGGSADTVAQ